MLNKPQAEIILKSLLERLENKYDKIIESRILLGLSHCFNKFGEDFCKPYEDKYHQIMKNYNLWDEIYHLSTAMCPAHRKKVIKNIKDDLSQITKRKILVISTQLIEAGVDFDFPCLFRATAPLESIIQSAGRCNREGKMNGYGKVFIFNLQDGKMPNNTYAACAGFAEELIKNDSCLRLSVKG